MIPFRTNLWAVVWYCSLLFPVAASGQEPHHRCDRSFSGRVIDMSTGEALPFANVYVRRDGVGAITAHDGTFVIRGICGSKAQVEVSHIGCETTTLDVNLEVQQGLVISLDHHQHQLSQVEVASEREESSLQLTTMRMRQAEIQLRQGQSLGELMEAIPGVSTLKTGPTIVKPVVDGLHSNRVILLNNGIRQEGQQWGMEHAPEIDPYMAREVSLHQGPDALVYASDGLGGVLLIKPAPLPENTGIGGSISTAAFSNNREGNVSATVEGRISDQLPLSYRVQGTLRKGGNARTPDYYLGNTGVREQNFNYAVGYMGKKLETEVFYSQFNQDIGIYSNAHIGNLTDLINAISGQVRWDTAGFTYDINRPYQHIEHELFKMRGAWKTASRGMFELTAARQYNRRQEFDKHFGYGGSPERLTMPQLDYRLTTRTIDFVWHHHTLLRALQGKMGGQIMQRVNNFTGRDFLPRYESMRGGVFMVENYHRNRWALRGGLRFDAETLNVQRTDPGRVHHFSGLAGAFAASYELSPDLALTMDLSSLWRAPAVNEMYSQGVHHGVAAIEVGNPNLNTERMLSASARLNYTHPRGSAMLRVYNNAISNYIYLKPTAWELTIRGAFPRFDYVQANGRFTGVDVQGDWMVLPKWQFYGRGQLLWAENADDGSFFPMIPPQSGEAGLRFMPQSGKANAFFALSVLANAHQYRAPDNIFDYMQGNNWQQIDPPANFDFAAPPPGFVLLGLNASWPMRVGKSTWSVMGGVDNLLNKQYRNYMNRFRYFADETGRNIWLKLFIPF